MSATVAFIFGFFLGMISPVSILLFFYRLGGVNKLDQHARELKEKR